MLPAAPAWALLPGAIAASRLATLPLPIATAPVPVAALLSPSATAPWPIALLGSPIATAPSPEAILPAPIETDAPFSRSEEHTSELQSLMRISYAVFCLKKKTQHNPKHQSDTIQPC